MAKAKSTRPVSGDIVIDRKIRNYIFLNLLFVLLGIFLLDALGLVNLKQAIFPLVMKVPGLNRMVPSNVEDPYLLSREERKKEYYTLKVWEETLNKRDTEIKSKEIELKSTENKLVQDRDEIEMMKKDFDQKKNEYNNYKKNIQQQAEYIESMRPEEAVARLKEMDDMTVIDILREIERRAKVEGRTSIVSYLLSLIEPRRASQIQKKMMNMEE